jgi:membrane protease subunit HflC
MERSRETGRAASSRRLGAAIVIAAILAVMAAARLCLFVVDTGEYALVTEFGKPIKVIKAAGLGFKYPYQSVRTFDSRLFVYTPPSSEFLTLEKTQIVAASTILWRIADPKRFYETVFNKAGAESRLGDILFAELGAAIGRNPLSAFVSVEPGAYGADTVVSAVAQKCREIALQDYGITLVDIGLQSFGFPIQNRPRLYARMTSERGQLSMRYRSEGEEEGLKIRAKAEEEKTHILSTALKLAQQYRAEGDGEAARIYAEAYGAAPDFYHFLRTMEASRSIFHKGTTLVLPADSEMFRLLYDSKYRGGPAGVTGNSEDKRARDMSGRPGSVLPN